MRDRECRYSDDGNRVTTPSGVPKGDFPRVVRHRLRLCIDTSALTFALNHTTIAMVVGVASLLLLINTACVDPIHGRGVYSNRTQVMDSAHDPFSTSHVLRSTFSWCASSPLPIMDCHRLMRFPDDRFWASIYSAEITSGECLSNVQSLLCSSCKIAVARTFEGVEAQTFVDFLDRVSEVWMPPLNCSGFQKQVLTQVPLDDKLRQRGLPLLYKICKARGITPSSYLLRQEFLRVGRVHCRGGFADVSGGEYLGSPVAIKYLRMEGEDPHTVFKVLSIDPAYLLYSVLPRGYVGR